MVQHVISKQLAFTLQQVHQKWSRIPVFAQATVEALGVPFSRAQQEDRVRGAVSRPVTP